MNAPDRARGLAAMPRRTFLKTTGVAGAAAGLEGILAARRAPAVAQGTKLHLLQWVDFIPEGDVEVKRQVAEYTKQTKVEVTFETINANDLQARITAATDLARSKSTSVTAEMRAPETTCVIRRMWS